MTIEEIEFTSNKFEYNEIKYDCTLAIKKDIEGIIREAKDSHGDTFNKLYNEKSLRPKKIRFFILSNTPIYCMIIYIIDYKNLQTSRLACGNYYPFYHVNNKYIIMPHPFQESICW